MSDTTTSVGGRGGATWGTYAGGVSVSFNTSQFVKKPNSKIRTVTVRLDKVDATQLKVDPAKVKSIAARGPDDGALPLVHKFRGRYKVGDGHNRIGGAIERGDTKIKVKLAP